MSRKLRLLFAVAIAAALASAPAPVAAQAFTPPRGLGAVTLAWQYVDNTGHRFSDGFLLARGQSVTQSALVELDYGVTYVSAVGNGQRTHGGLRVGSPTGHPFLVPGELNTAERFAQRDRLLRANYLQVGGGLAYAAGAVDVFASFAKYVWGRNAHNGQDYNVGATWYFRLSK